MSVHAFPKPAESFLDRWGHWLLWMGPYILIISVLAWTPWLALLLICVELVQFTVHAVRHHPDHPMADTMSIFVVCVVLIFGIALVPSVEIPWLFLLVVSQIILSNSVHRWIHHDFTGCWFDQWKFMVGLVYFCVMGFVAIILMTGDGDVHGLPLLRAFLL